MTRVKAIYRSWAIPCTGKQVFMPRAIVPSGSRKSANRECAGERKFSLPAARCAALHLRQEVRRGKFCWRVR